ncbi:MAG: acyl-CoA thioesterase [Deltaproteobacteria bacterium]|jgi:acyl-CoA thioester hydrolase|nr:acyl-CoA thioesterase [Deltaproteobacteria bacterium]
MSTTTLPKPGPFVSTTWYRVLYADTDNMRVVYNGHYFRFFEQGRNEFMRQLGFPYTEVERRGVSTAITETGAHYYASFHYDELIRIESWIAKINRASFRFEYKLYLEHSDAVRVSGFSLLAVVDGNKRIIKIPDWLLEIINPAAPPARPDPGPPVSV